MNKNESYLFNAEMLRSGEQRLETTFWSRSHVSWSHGL